MAHSKRIQSLDSIRGILLLQMVLDHFSGPISHYIYQCFGFFSAAEGFFFLSGFVGMLAVISKTSRGENSCWMLRRASRIWIYHILSVLALALAAFFFFPKIRHFFSGLYEHPLGGSTLAATLIYTPEWLDVLPLYVILLAIGFFALPQIARGRLKQVWAISFLIWIFAQGPLRSTFLQFVPHWAYPGFFDFFAWQFIYFCGAAICALWKFQKSPLKTNGQILDCIFPICITLCVFLFLWRHDALPIPQPDEFWISKEHLGLLRFINFLAFVGIISFVIRHKPLWLDFSFCRILGRHSLEIYSVHTLLIYLWMATPAAIQYRSPFNMMAPILCSLLLIGIAQFLERQNKAGYKQAHADNAKS